MHGGGDGFEWMVPVAVGDGSPPGHLPHLPPASLIPVRHVLPGHMQLGPPMYGGPCCWTHTGALVLPSAMWGEGDADFLMLHLTGPTCFHRNGAYLPPPTGFHEHGQWVQEVPPPMRKQQQQQQLPPKTQKLQKPPQPPQPPPQQPATPEELWGDSHRRMTHVRSCTSSQGVTGGGCSGCAWPVSTTVLTGSEGCP